MTGIGRYCLELANRLPVDPRIENLRFLHGTQWIKRPLDLVDGMPSAWRPPRLWRKLIKLFDHQSFRGALTHSPNYFLPERAEGGIATVHDLSVFKYPETHPAERIADFERRFSKTIARADHFVVDSETVRQELIEFAGLDGDRVTAVHLGIAPEFQPRTSDQCRPVLDHFGLGFGAYALCVSSFEPRKRIAKLIVAYRELPQALRQHIPLVLVGGVGWLNEELLDAIARAEAEGWLRSLGYVADNQLHLLYSGAGLFVYPSTYEGFGLPPVEAMASGVPVVTANCSCLPEITGGAAMLLDPDDVIEFKKNLERALTDEIWRAQAVKKGRAVAKQYNWNRCVAETVDVYARTINERV